MRPTVPRLVALAALVAVASAEPVRAASATADEQKLREAGLAADGPSLLAFFHGRARTAVDGDHLGALLRRFASAAREERGPATAEFLGLGPLALPVLRQAANDLDRPEVAGRASRCLPWLDGPAGDALLAAAARALAARRPEGAAAALLAYLPCATNPDVIGAVNAALAAVAAPDGRADAAMLRGLSDASGVRRAAAGAALCRAAPADQWPAVRKLLADPAPAVRRRAALALAEAGDAAAIPVLIDLLADLLAEERRPVEEFLTPLAGEWAPVLQLSGDDDISRHIRRDAWASWWHHTDGEALLAALRKHTLTAQTQARVEALLAQLGDEEFTTREKASAELFALGRLALPQLGRAAKNRDPEVARRAGQLIERIEREPAHHLPVAAIRLLAVRRPAGAVEALLAYFPHAEDESRAEEVRKTLAGLARQNDGQPDPTLRQALSDARPLLREVAGQALVRGGGAGGRSAARALLRDEAPVVRLRVALALALAGERGGVAVLIELLSVLPDEGIGEVEVALSQLAGDTAPSAPARTGPAERKKCRDAWAAWWTANGGRADLSRLTDRPWYGYTLICDCGRNRVFELDRQGKERWAIEGVGGPVDAWVLPGDRVLIAECNTNLVTERNLKGEILWQKQANTPVNVQRLAGGNTFIATNNGPILEVDRNGKEVYTIPNVPGNLLAAYRSRDGTIVCMTQNGQCLLLDTAGKQLKSFAANHDGNSMGGLDLLPNGHILVARQTAGKVAEFDRAGKAVRELDAPAARTASRLPDGHILVASQTAQRIYELDRGGKTVWEHKGAGQFFRARRR